MSLAEPRDRWMSPLIEGCEEVNAIILEPLLDRSGWAKGRWRTWWIMMGVAAVFTALFVVGLYVELTRGVGVFGNNSTIVWGFPIANYVWWIGIGNAGTLISALLLLTRQPWRAAINRFAEAMTLFSVSIAGIFPIIHLGRPMFFFWLAPYPNPMTLWPQWRSALVWDFWAILSYLIFSIVFWYTGLIPDLATLRDRAKTPLVRKIYGVFALGFRNSARQWAIHQSFYKVMAGLAVPLVCSVHSIVGLDFAASLMPGWQESLFPPYFVVGAMFSGFAMVVLLGVLIRSGLGFKGLVTDRHFDAIGKIIVASACVMGASYATEWFMSWYSGERAERAYIAYVFTGTYWPLYAIMMLGNVFLPQILWFKRARASIPTLVVVSIGVLIGMWFERILIIWNTLGHGYLPTLWRTFWPTFWDYAVMAGSVGFFVFMFLIFVRVIPSVSMFETRELAMQERRP
jgi:molybdopterin-containing oxidoreductase family membrane subunit